MAKFAEPIGFFAENRAWLRTPHGTDDNAKSNVTLNTTLFPEALLLNEKYIPSGTVIGKVTATGEYGAFDAAASDGREVAAGILFNTRSLSEADGDNRIFDAMLVHGGVTVSRLPHKTGAGALVDGQLPHIVRY